MTLTHRMAILSFLPLLFFRLRHSGCGGGDEDGDTHRARAGNPARCGSKEE